MPVLVATRHDVVYRQLSKREFQEIYMNKKAGLFIDCDITRRNITTSGRPIEVVSLLLRREDG